MGSLGKRASSEERLPFVVTKHFRPHPGDFGREQSSIETMPEVNVRMIPKLRGPRHTRAEPLRVGERENGIA